MPGAGGDDMSRWLASASLAAFLTLPLVAAPPEKDAPGGGNVYKKAIKSVTWIVAPRDEGFGQGSGSLIDRNDRIVITNYHVVRDAETVFVMFPIYENGAIVTDRPKYDAIMRSGSGIKAKVLAREPKKDLAIIKLDKIPSDATGIRLAKEPIGTGDRIHCIGNAGVSGGLWSYTPGDVKNFFTQKARTTSRSNPRDGFNVEFRAIESTALVNEGDSGGPVLNGAGELVGVTQGYRGGEEARGVSYAIDLSEIKGFLKENKYGRLLNTPATATTAAVETPADTAAAPPVENKPDPAKQAQIAATKLSFAKDLIRNGKKERARERLDEIVKEYPDTPAATEAKQLLESLK
jgi:S1-C subfamily serine protease